MISVPRSGIVQATARRNPIRAICLHFIALQRSTISQSRPQRNSFSGIQDQHQRKPVFTSRKLSQILSVRENKPPIVNTQCVVHLFQYDLCDANYVGFTARHLHQRISEHRYSAIGRHLEAQHGSKGAKIDPSLQSFKEMQKQVCLSSIRDAVFKGH